MKKIAVVTGTRAEYGLLKPLMELIKKRNEHELRLFVTGMHLSPEFGLTYKEIVKDGFSITDQVEMLLSSDSDCGVTKSIGLGIIGFSDAFRRNRPDMVIVLGDRFETFAAVQAAYFTKIPVAHLHGGELTEGLIDDGIRHSISKMSHLHFTSTEIYRQRLIRMGEDPKVVYNVGAIGIDNIVNQPLIEKEALALDLGVNFSGRTALVTFHPVTLEDRTAEEQVHALLEAIDSIEDLKIIFTKPNADMDGRIISTLIDRYVEKNKHKAVVHTSLGMVRYLSTVKYVDVVIGNSSSGLIEVPSFFKPTVNIGSRQDGRLKAESVIDCDNNVLSIAQAIDRALSSDFKAFCLNIVNPYGYGGTAEKIVDAISAHLKEGISIKKAFYDRSET